jgi:8-oxo-dGTP pyrophosphatase MutT (NUDIX family)
MKPGGPEFLLVTTRGSKRWSIPKGYCEASAEARQTALSEAYEEAGLRGAIPREPIGIFSHVKRAPPDKGECLVLVYPMKVTKQVASWPEKGQRRLIWAGAREAAELVDAGLSGVIRRFAATLIEKKQTRKGGPN